MFRPGRPRATMLGAGFISPRMAVTVALVAHHTRCESFLSVLGMSVTLVDVLRARAEESADELAFQFLIDGETEGPRYSYAELDAQGRAIAVTLRRFTGQQERALLIYPP